MLVKLTRYFLSLTSLLVDSFCLSIVLHYDCFFMKFYLARGFLWSECWWLDLGWSISFVS